MTTELATRDQQRLAEARYELSIDELVAQVQKIQQAMTKVMHDGEHYGVVPGTSKPTLLKAGAEKLTLLFRLDPEYSTEKIIDGQHLTAMTTCTLFHIPTGNRVASGQGLCTSRESKYAFRKGERVCPECGQSTIIKGRPEYGGGWLCYQKKGGCGAKWPDHAQVIESQDVGQVPNPNPADTWNTIVKMACKRALVAAALNATAASDIFTQDLEDITENAQAAGADRTAAAAHADYAADRAQTAATTARPATPPADAAPVKMPDARAAAQAAATAGFGAPKMPAANVAAPLGICEVHKIPWVKPRTGGGPGHYFTPAIPRGDGKGEWCHQSKPKDAPPLAQVAAEVAAARQAALDRKEESDYREV